jgi:acyl-coenzyme A synthetase/AMP-(fatty) acid ligase
MELRPLDSLVSRLASKDAVGTHAAQDWARLAGQRDRWRDALVAAKARRVALYFENSFDFSAALLGAWAAGCSAVLAGDVTEATASALRPQADHFLGGFPAALTPWTDAPDAPGAAALPLPTVPVVIFTSGSTGEPVAVEKVRSDLEQELQSLEAAFGSGLGPARILSTVSHQHIYGLLFRCLWPLCAGRVFSDRMIRFPEELEAETAQGGELALVASPAFLKRLPEALKAGTLAGVFSSGGPLSWDAAQASTRLLGVTPTEVYGSSETGGIAWRRSTRPDQRWTVFPGVQLAAGEGQSLVLLRSPHSAAAASWPLADRGEIDAGGFRLLGRSDRIVKLEEKRVSLTAMEALLAAHPAVAEARVVAFSGERETLGAVLRLAQGPIPGRGTAERNALIGTLRSHLLAGFERAVLPRRWRLVEALPLNDAGKTTEAALKALFEPLLGPVILAAKALEDGSAVLDLALPAELEYFRGHFPGVAILPGVTQLHWAIEEGRRRFGPWGSFRGLKALKFQRPLAPGTPVRLELKPLKGKPGIAFTYDSALGRHSSGQVLFEP